MSRLWLLILAIFISISVGDYADGQLRVGDIYNEPIKQNYAYQIFQLPSGVNVNGITFDTKSTGTFLMSFYVCPQDYDCTFQKSITEFIVRIQMDDLKIVSKKDVALHLDKRVIPFNPDSRGDVYALGDGKFVYKIDLKTDQVVDRFPQEPEYVIDDRKERIVRGEIDIEKDRMFLSFENSTIIKVSLKRFKEDSVVHFSSEMETSSIQSEFAINKKTSKVYVVARFGNQKDQSFSSVFETSEELYQTRERNTKPIPFPAEHLLGLFTDSDSEYLYALFSESKQEKEERSMRKMTLYQISTDNLNVTSQIEFTSMEFVSYFFSKTKDYLYIYTLGGELIRFSLKHELKMDKMTFVMYGHDRKSYDPKYMPSLRAAKAFDDHIAYITADNGLILKVNLTNFCSDEFDCDEFPKWMIPLIGIVIGSIAAAGLGWWFISFQFRKRKEYRSRIRFNDILTDTDKLSAPSTPVPRSHRDYGAINVQTF